MFQIQVCILVSFVGFINLDPVLQWPYSSSILLGFSLRGKRRVREAAATKQIEIRFMISSQLGLICNMLFDIVCF
ncbi:hypothetical protein CARUB_v10012667mg [Capsella rubella]|uniref:Uncharacterized protein n=1 Tax=Capsella rubella TaxID=81985 RepID=R0ILL6_9BRAS|nr:hypothetical protein CARUB_v10012667mg [Capsella rubella]